MTVQCPGQGCACSIQRQWGVQDSGAREQLTPALVAWDNKPSSLSLHELCSSEQRACCHHYPSALHTPVRYRHHMQSLPFSLTHVTSILTFLSLSLDAHCSSSPDLSIPAMWWWKTLLIEHAGYVYVLLCRSQLIKLSVSRLDRHR